MADPKTCAPLTRASIRNAHDLIKSHIHRTPVLTCETLNRIASNPAGPDAPSPKFRLFFKCENLQRIGAFKARGAFHALKHLIQQEGLEELRKRGVITHSSGNHSQALALAASTFSIPAYIVMPTVSPASKIAGTKHYTKNVIFSGSTSHEREAKVAEVMKQTNAMLVPPYDHPDIILGQGTAALELDEQYKELVEKDSEIHKSQSINDDASSTILNGGSESRQQASSLNRSMHTNPADSTPVRQLDAVMVPLGGGGLLSGVATYFSESPNSGKKTLVFGAEPSFQGGDDGRRGIAAGKRIDTVKTMTIADGLRTPVGLINWTVVSDPNKLEGIYAVSDEQIKEAMRLVLERMKVFVEPSACVGLAVILYNEEFREMVAKKQLEAGEGRPWDIGVIFSGGNTTLDAIIKIFGTPADTVSTDAGPK